MSALQEFQKEFWIQLCSTPESKYLMAEVWYQNFLIATVDRENGPLTISFAGGRKANHTYEYVSVDFVQLLETLEKAKQALS
jgi:hypothetical protein